MSRPESPRLGVRGRGQAGKYTLEQPPEPREGAQQGCVGCARYRAGVCWHSMRLSP